jgi:hypothetical protein
MECTLEEFKKINELEETILVVANLIDILLEYRGEKDCLIDILSEKAIIMKNQLENFTSCLIK